MIAHFTALSFKAIALASLLLGSYNVKTKIGARLFSLMHTYNNDGIPIPSELWLGIVTPKSELYKDMRKSLDLITNLKLTSKQIKSCMESEPIKNLVDHMRGLIQINNAWVDHATPLLYSVIQAGDRDKLIDLLGHGANPENKMHRFKSWSCCDGYSYLFKQNVQYEDYDDLFKEDPLFLALSKCIHTSGGLIREDYNDYVEIADLLMDTYRKDDLIELYDNMRYYKLKNYNTPKSELAYVIMNHLESKIIAYRRKHNKSDAILDLRDELYTAIRFLEKVFDKFF